MDSLIETAIGAVKSCESGVMRHFKEGSEVTIKADSTPVTEADKNAERQIIDFIRARFPDHGFLGEEFGHSPGSQYLWIIDPIDGTKNFSSGIPLFGTQLALMIDGELVLGVSNMPAIGELLYGEIGSGSFLNESQVGVSEAVSLEKASITLGGLNKFKSQGFWSGVETLVHRCSRVRAFGDAYAYHLVATGRFDAAVECSIKIWDIAALVAIITAAGGRCTTLDGRPVDLEVTSIVASNPHLHSQLIPLFAS